jgi:hypothetical protein
MATRGCACRATSSCITVVAPILAAGMATTNSSHVFDPHQVDGSVVFEHSNFLGHKGSYRQQEVLIFLVELEGLRQPQLFGARQPCRAISPNRYSEISHISPASSLSAKSLHPRRRAKDGLGRG